MLVLSAPSDHPGRQEAIITAMRPQQFSTQNQMIQTRSP